MPNRILTASLSVGGGTLTAWKRRSSERSEEHTSELQSQSNLVCRLLLEKKKKNVLVVLLDLFLIMLPRLGWMPDVSASYTRHIVKYFSRRVHMLFEDMLWVERTALVRVD